MSSYVVDKSLKFMTHGQCNARPTVTFPAAWHRCCSTTGTKLCCLVTEAHVTVCVCVCVGGCGTVTQRYERISVILARENGEGDYRERETFWSSPTHSPLSCHHFFCSVANWPFSRRSRTARFTGPLDTTTTTTTTPQRFVRSSTVRPSAVNTTLFVYKMPTYDVFDERSRDYPRVYRIDKWNEPASRGFVCGSCWDRLCSNSINYSPVRM